MKRVVFCILFFVPVLVVLGQSSGQKGHFSGKVIEKNTLENLTGAVVTVKLTSGDFSRSSGVGLDGSFNMGSVPAGKYLVKVSFVGYLTLESEIEISGEDYKEYELEPSALSLDAVFVTAQLHGTDREARKLERLSSNVINIISSRQIELSPDITVANVVQRVSGLSIERNANGDPQYAVVRGMNKRYNNTLVNGIKIPSPDNDNRFVPLDIFPAVFLEKLTVSKSLSADMEADAIGGTIDMVMKSAPRKGRFLDFDFQSGMNTMNLDGKFVAYDRSEVYKKSPAERYGSGYEAIAEDFSPLQFDPKKRILADILASASYGSRFAGNKLGVLAGASFQNTYRPSENYFYDPTVLNLPGNPLRMNELIERRTSTQQQRMAFHAKIDYDLSPENTLSFYVGQYLLNEFRVREQFRQESFVVPTGYAVYPVTRITNTYQTISIANLSGKHTVTDRIKVDWNGVYSMARNEVPDDAVFIRSANYDAVNKILSNERVYTQGSNNTRVWERNQDNDLSFYVNGTYSPENITLLETLKIGGVFRNKTRNNYYNYYKYRAPNAAPGVRWEDWYYFRDIQFDGLTNGFGDGNESNMIYDADETIAGYFINSNWKFSRLLVQGGVRVEHTQQGYTINPASAKANATDLSGKQNYFNVFPSLGVKWALNSKTWLKSTYYKGISRPGFFEIVPTQRPKGGGDSFYSEVGNPELRPTIGHSADIRYELFPNDLDQLLIGVFYKKLTDPIEYGFPKVESANDKPSTGTILPQNFGTANNFGIEIDYTKYFRQIGVRANYTYTNSSITTNKIVMNPAGAETAFSLTEETRALQGQSDHVGNVSLLYKNTDRGWDAQLVLNYTGKRLAVVSPYEGADQWMRPMAVLDFSAEKTIKRVVIFLKANNLLNTPYQLIVNKPIGYSAYPYAHQEDPARIGNIRRDTYGQSFRLGMRFKL